MSVLVQTVTYEVEGGDLNLFRAAVHKHAEVTRQREVGCTRFDVSYGADRPTLETVWIDEIPLAYMDRPLSRLRAKVAGPPRA